MSHYPVSCILVQAQQPANRLLEGALRRAAARLSLRQVQHASELTKNLTDTPALLLWDRPLSAAQENQLVGLLQQRSPDTILVKCAPDRWEALEKRLVAIEVCMITTANATVLDQQLDYLLSYAGLKQRFRYSKHLLRLSELRCEWLSDQARIPLAYLVQGKHEHVNVPYLSLFGVERDTELLHKPFLSLVQEEERGILTSLLKGAEQRVQPSNKVLTTLYQNNGHTFRGEVRFIPAVFRGQRCVQAYIQALDRYHEAIPQQLRPLETDPWLTPAALITPQQNKSFPTIPVVTVAMDKQFNHKPNNVAAPAKTALSDKIPVKAVQPNGLTTLRLQTNFRETLTIQSHGADLLLVEPYLQTDSGKRVHYAQLKRYAERHRNRPRLDSWILRQAMARALLPSRRGAAFTVLLWMEVGDCLLTDKRHVTDYLRTLRTQPMIANRLVLSIRLESFVRYEANARHLLPVLKKMGVLLALEANLALDMPSVERAKELGISFIRLNIDSAQVQQWALNRATDTSLQILLKQLAQMGMQVVIEGLADITSINCLAIAH